MADCETVKRTSNQSFMIRNCSPLSNFSTKNIKDISRVSRASRRVGEFSISDYCGMKKVMDNGLEIEFFRCPQ